jgi:diaminopimelate decarboxylase
MKLGGIPAHQLASEYGTPALILDLDVLDLALERILGAAERHGIGVSYAAKALFLVGLAQRLRARKIGIDVASLGEILTAERGGIEPSRITLHGAGKTGDEIEAAFAGRVGRLAVDSLDELRRIIAAARGRSLDLLLRINTGIEAHTHEFVRTAGDDSKFGLSPSDFAEALDVLKHQPHLRLRGLHSHVGSQIFDAAPFVANAEYLSTILVRAQELGFAHIDTMVVGGGFGVQTNPAANDETIDIEAVLEKIARVVPLGIHAEIEPGRAIVAPCGTTLYRVMAVKRYDKRTFVVVDGSMADNPRPALYGAYHHIVAVAQSAAPLHEVTVAGRSCENDELGTAMLPSDIAFGSLLAVQSTGAYTYSMASNYNRFAKPSVIGIERGKPIVLARRETYEDVLAADV